MNTSSKSENYVAIIEVTANAKQSSKAVSNVDKWWAKNFRGSALKEGDEFTVDFGETFVDFRVTKLVEGEIIKWLITDCNLHWQNNKKEWNGTEIEWLFKSIDHGTQIKMTHIGLTPEVECYEMCNKGWDEHIKTSLSNYIKSGKGQPQ